MTTEDDFHRALDANPTDWQTRLVLADWLDEQGDPRAEGYRALGVNEMHPMVINGRWGYLRGSLRLPGAQWVPHDWHGEYQIHDSGEFALTRRAVEDAAALAFAKLPADRRAELLAVPVGDRTLATVRARTAAILAGVAGARWLSPEPVSYELAPAVAGAEPEPGEE